MRARAALETPQAQRETGEDRQRDEQLDAVAKRRAGVAGEEVLRDRLQAFRQRPAPDPLRAVAALRGDQRQQRRADDRERRDRGQRGALRVRGSQAATAPSGSAGTRRSSGCTSASAPVSANSAMRRGVGSPPRAQEAQHRERRHQHEQPVRARLLRVPHEQRVDGDERRAHDRRAARRRARARSPTRPAPSRSPRAPRAGAARPRRCRARASPPTRAGTRAAASSPCARPSAASRTGSACRTCTGVNASSYQKLCRSSVDSRSARREQRQRRQGPPRAARARRPRPGRAPSPSDGALTAGTLPPGRTRSSRSACCARLRSRGQVPAAVDCAPAVHDRPPDRQADLRAAFGGPALVLPHSTSRCVVEPSVSWSTEMLW